MSVSITIGIPQAILLGFYGLALILSVKDHGKPREPTNAWNMIASIVLQLALMWWGGFF